MIEKILSYIISTIIMIITYIYIWNKIDKIDKKKIDSKNIIIFAFCCIATILNYIYINDLIKPVTATIILIFYCSFIMGKFSNKSIVLPIYSQILVIISEFIFALMVILIFGANVDNIVSSYYGQIFTNCLIAIIASSFSKIKYNLAIYNKIISITDRINRTQLAFVVTIILLIASFFTAFFYYKINLIYLLIFNLFIIVIYFIFTFYYLKANNNYVKVYDKYNTTLNSLKEYEDILSRYRVSNHENKNQLLTIRGMVKNKKVISYIDEIIENKLKDNEKLMFESLVIPEGGLRGLIYSKMLLMNEKGIHFDLCVDSILKTTDLTCISDDLMLNICNIVGVYLDNAIEAVENLKEKYIIIEIYLDKTLNIAITNNYENDIDIDNIDSVGFSTKGNNHGYGLSLVKDILNNNKNITNYKQISDDEFTQEIRIKYKK